MRLSGWYFLDTLLFGGMTTFGLLGGLGAQFFVHCVRNTRFEKNGNRTLTNSLTILAASGYKELFVQSPLSGATETFTAGKTLENCLKVVNLTQYT